MAAMWKWREPDSSFLKNLSLNGDAYCSSTHTRMLVAAYDDYLVTWSREKQCLIAVNTRVSPDGVGEDECQDLLLSNPPLFEVDNVLVSCTKHLLLTGRHGITVVALPKTPAALLKEKALCRSWSVGEHFFLCHKSVALVDVAWHPDSESGRHVLALTSDSNLRLFDITEPHSAQLLLQVGVHHGGTGGTLGASLGDAAASFDFGDVPPDGEARQVFVLMGSGDIYLTHVSPEDDNRSHQRPVLGPLTMLPQAEDNYGVDGYSLICLPAPVPLLAIATTGGTLYHCFALGTEDSFSLGNREDEEEVTLFVFEKIRLELTFSQSESDEDSFLCPIRLCKDPTDPQRYICLHNSGVHAVALPFIDHLQAFAGEGTGTEALSELQSEKSIVENLVCTRALASSKPAPPVGMAVIPCHPGPRLVVLMATWKLVIIALAPGHQSYMPELLSQSPPGASSSAQGDAAGDGGGVLAHVQQLLAGGSLPQLSGAADDCTAQQSLELLLSATQRIRDHWIPRLETCQLLITRRAQAAEDQRDLQMEKLNTLAQELETLQKRNDVLRQRYEAVYATQQKLVKRVEDLLHRLQGQVPVLSLAEQSMTRELQSIEEELRGFRELLEQARLKQHYQQQQEHGSGDQEDVPLTVFGRRPARLTERQAQHIRAALKHEGDAIADLVQRLSALLQ